MTVYAPDTDFFINVQRLGYVERVASCGRLPVVVTDIVWEEATTGKNPHANSELEGLLRAVAGSPRALLPQSPEAATFAALQAPPKTEDPGEHSIIALAIHEPELVPVLLDKKALHRAVEELRRPLLSMHGFLDGLVTAGSLPRELGLDLAEAYRKKCATPTPHWWPAPHPGNPAGRL